MIEFNNLFHFITFNQVQRKRNRQNFKVVFISFTKDNDATTYKLQIRAETLNIYAKMSFKFFID